MIGLKGTVVNGQVVLDEPTELMEGTKVQVVPVGTHLARAGVEDGPMSPEEIASVLTAMDHFEPPLTTPEEEARWKADLKEQRDHDTAAFAQRAERLRRMWE